jgi:hypothetical protein
MLVDFEPVAGVLGQIYKPEELWQKQEPGVFLTHLNGCSQHFPEAEEFPEFADYRSSYGVCDNVEQIKQHYPDVFESTRKFVVCMTPIIHAEETEQDFRWHKWGPYIGNHKPQHEYLFDEVGIEQVFVFRILEVQ